MSIPKIIERSKKFFLDTFNTECDVIGIKNEGNKFLVTVETIVDQEYSKRRALPEVVAQYVLYMDHNMDVMEYERKELRKRYNLE